MKSELVQIEVDLLLVKYGESAVLKALSVATGADEIKVKRKVKSLRETKEKHLTEKKEQKQPIDVATAVVEGSANEDLLGKLAVLYQNRQFLPQFKDVKRFLGRFNIGKSAKNRNDATKIVFESLKKCSREDISGFITDLSAGDQSSFSTLADHIMGSHDRKSSNN
jgi:hypothetical protein